LLKIVGLSFNRKRWREKLRFVLMKFVRGVMLITPDIGRPLFSCKRALSSRAPSPWAMMKVGS
jgi:hypothetical protein